MLSEETLILVGSAAHDPSNNVRDEDEVSVALMQDVRNG